MSLRSRPTANKEGGDAGPSKVKCSVIVPAYKEKENLAELTRRVFAALEKSGRPKETAELIVVDDNSNDGSVEVIEQMAKDGYPAKIIVRTKERGLSSAVLHGFENAKGSLLVCMDADLQHPPEKVPELFDAIDPDKQDAAFVIGTRYGGEGFSVDKDWPLHRRIVSSGARLLARPLSPLSDPMTGFFGLPSSVLARAGDNVNSIGFKIALELAVKTGVRKPAEVSIHFGVRVHGESKLSGKVILYYLQHLYDLYQFKYPNLVPFLIFLAFVVLYYLLSFLGLV